MRAFLHFELPVFDDRVILPRVVAGQVELDDCIHALGRVGIEAVGHLLEDILHGHVCHGSLLLAVGLWIK